MIAYALRRFRFRRSSRGGLRPLSGGREELGDLHGVQRGALAQVVPDDPEVKAAVVRGVATDAPDEHVVATSGVDREPGEITASRSPPRASSSAKAEARAVLALVGSIGG